MATQAVTLTDEQLSSSRLLLDDPLALPRLSRDKPNPALAPFIVGEYHLPRSHDLVFCAHCQGHSHRKGFAITNETGRHYLIGSECGPKHYGLDFKHASRDFKAKLKRQGVVDRMRAIWVNAAPLHAAIADLLQSPELRALDEKRRELQKASDSAFRQLVRSVSLGQPLFETVSVRNLAAEQMRDANRDEPGPPIYTAERLPLGAVAGAALLRDNDDCRARLLILRRSLEGVERLNKTATEKLPIGNLIKLVRAAEDAWSAAQTALEEVKFADAFFSGGNLGRLERWSCDNRYFQLLEDGGDLMVISREDISPRTRIKALLPLSLPDLPPLKD